MQHHIGTMEAQGVTIPYAWVQKNKQPKQLAVFLPGKEYGLQGPLLWYTYSMYWEQDFDKLEFNYLKTEIDEEKLLVTVNEMIVTFLQDKEYESIHFISLGLGSTIAGYFLTHQIYPNIKAVWYSPYMHHPNVIQALLNRPNKGLVFLGEMGDLIDEEAVPLLEEKDHLIVAHVAGGNDLLEIGFTEINLDVVKSIIQMIKQFIKTEHIEINHKKSEIQVYFSLYGDDFPLDEVTEKLGVQPTDTDKKGEEIIPPNGIINPNHRRYYTNTLWKLATEYESAVNLEDKMNEVIGKLRSKVFVINELRKKYDLTSHIQVVVMVEEGEMPVLTLNKKAISFAHQIQTDYINLDIYVMPFDDNIRFESDGINFKGRKL